MTLLAIEEVSKTFHTRGRAVVALDRVSAIIPEGEVTGLVGESGSGKSTLVRCIMGLQKPDSGVVDYDRIDVAAAQGRSLRRFRQEVQLVFQDPSSSLNPRMTVEQLLTEGMIVHRMYRTRAERRTQAARLLESVGLNPDHLPRYPRSFSGGQRQRIAIARALAVRPRLLVCDEPVSSLDVSVQAQVLNLLMDKCEQEGLTILLVAHDLAVIRHVCSRVAVLNRGRIVEHGLVEAVFTAPSDDYTRALIAAVPVPDPAARRQP
jgi:ABC-type oligopeptide transport system ATPase subunit